MSNSTSNTKTIADLKQEKENKVSALIKSTGAFFAFSNIQFDEGKTPLKEGDKYVSMGMGMYIPKSNVDEFLNGMESINKDYRAQTSANKKIRYDLIAYELANYECYYTGDITPALECLGRGYTSKEVTKVYMKERAKNNDY